MVYMRDKVINSMVLGITNTVETMFFMQVFDHIEVFEIQTGLNSVSMEVKNSIVTRLDLYAGDDFLDSVREVILDEQDISLEDVKDDILAEIMNMFSGKFLAEIGGLNHPFELGLPIRNPSYSDPSSQRIIVSVKVEAFQIYVVAHGQF